MPTYINTLPKSIFIENEDGDVIEVEGKAEFVTKISQYNKNLKEVSPFPYYAPIIKSIKNISGIENDVIKVPIYLESEIWEILNNSSSIITLHYDDPESEGLDILPGASLSITDKNVKNINNFVLVLKGIVNANEVVINQFRSN